MPIDQEARRQKRLETFRQVVAERVGRRNLAWIDFETMGVDPAGFLRESHTLKGEASLTGFLEVSRLVHLIEGFVKLVRDRRQGPDQRAGDLVLRGLDLITALVQAEPGACLPRRRPWWPRCKRC